MAAERQNVRETDHIKVNDVLFETRYDAILQEGRLEGGIPVEHAGLRLLQSMLESIQKRSF